MFVDLVFKQTCPPHSLEQQIWLAPQSVSVKQFSVQELRTVSSLVSESHPGVSLGSGQAVTKIINDKIDTFDKEKMITTYYLKNSQP